MMPPDEDAIAELVAPIDFFESEEPEEVPELDLDDEDRNLLLEVGQQLKKKLLT